MLSLVLWYIDRIHSHDAIRLIGEEAGCIVRVDNGRARKDAFGWVAWKDGDGLVGPGVQIY